METQTMDRRELMRSRAVAGIRTMGLSEHSTHPRPVKYDATGCLVRPVYEPPLVSCPVLREYAQLNYRGKC